MANIAKLNLAVFFNGKAAEQGLKKLGDQFSGLKNKFTEIKSAIDLTQAGFAKLTQFFELGGKIETTQITMGYLAGDFQKGARTLEELRQVSMDTGAPIESLTAGFKSLTAAGLSTGTAAYAVTQAAKAAELLGGGAQGVQTFTNAMGAMVQTGLAQEGTLQALQQGGLMVNQQLAESLSRITGRAMTVADAMQAVKRGAVLSSTAIQAVNDAANSPQALLAKQRFEASFEGQIARLKTTVLEALTDINKFLLEKLNFTALISGIRGFFAGVREMVFELLQTLGQTFDPAGNLGNVQTAFEAGKKLSIDIAEILVKGGLELSQSLINAAKVLWETFNMPSLIDKYAEGLGIIGEGTGVLPKGTVGELQRMEKAQQPQFPDLTGAMRAADDFFAKARGGPGGNWWQNNIGGVVDGIGKGIQEAQKKIEEEKARAEMAKKSLDALIRDTMETLRTPIEEFELGIQNISDIGKQAVEQFRESLLGGEDLDRLAKMNKRKAGKMLQDFVSQNGMGDSFIAARADRGSAAAVESIVRNRFGEGQMSTQERIKAATERAAKAAEEQLKAQERLIAAYEAQKPGTLIIP